VLSRRAKAGVLWAVLVAAALSSSAAGAWEARVLEATVNDLAFDPVSKRLYASVPSWVGPYGNSILPIDPAAGRAGKPVFVGSEPGVLALSDDGSTLWVSLAGALSIRRVALPALVPGLEFTVVSEYGNPFLVEDIEVQPGNPGVIAVSRYYQEGISPRHAGVAVYEDGVLRRLATPGHIGANRIEFAGDPGRMIGIDNESSPPSFFRIRVDDDGASVIDVSEDVAGGVGVELEFAGGRGYQTQGSVVDPSVPSIVGNYPALPGIVSDVVADPAADRVYFLYHAGIAVYDLDGFEKLETIQIPGIRGFVRKLVQWGPGALAFIDSGQVFLVTLAPFDGDGDGVPDRSDNCCETANAAQADADHDGVGDACDAKPGASDGAVPQCRYDLGVAENELAQCWAEPRFVDADRDGVHDGHDLCPQTPLGAGVVDDAGCSLAEFCAPRVSECERADWRNDEPRKPADCRRVGTKKRGYLCVPW
jgi:hypothetical protein